MSPSRVAIVRCESYDPEAVDLAVTRGLGLLGGAGVFVSPGEQILLKPNLLVPSAPDNAVTTHPAVFRSVARALQGAGAVLTYGDSPGVGSTALAARRCGLAEVAEELGVPLVAFDKGREVAFPAGVVYKQFVVADAVLEADGVVSLPKMKTHGLTRMTGAVKNQLGCVPGLHKNQWHACAPELLRFCQMLVDLGRLLRPRLFVMDAVVAMEGNGPRSGDPRQMSVLILSDDPIAMDATACRVMNLDTSLVPTIAVGKDWGLGEETDIEYLGDPLTQFVVEDFAANRAPLPTERVSGRVGRLMKRWMVARPRALPERCTSCGTCVSVCPVSPEAVRLIDTAPHGGRPVFDLDTCIRCYCCQELCPERAIEVYTPLIGRVARRS